MLSIRYSNATNLGINKIVPIFMYFYLGGEYEIDL